MFFVLKKSAAEGALQRWPGASRGLERFQQLFQRHSTRTVLDWVRVQSGLSRGMWIEIAIPGEGFLWRGEHEPEVQDAIHAVLTQGTVFYDVGAHVGTMSLGAANVVGEVGAFVSIVALCRLLPLDGKRRPDRSWYFLVLVLGCSALLASQTRNDLAAFLFGFGLIILTSKRIRLGLALAAATVPVMALAGLNSKIYDYLLRGQTENEITSLTGRMNWWGYAWQQFQHHPFTGLGAYAAGRFAILGKLGLDMGSLHSDYIETMVGTGLWGLVPLLAALIGTWWLLVRFVRDRSLTSLERQLAYESIGVLGVVTLHSFFNVEIVWQAPLAFLTVLGYAEFLRRKQKAAHAIQAEPVEFGVLATDFR